MSLALRLLLYAFAAAIATGSSYAHAETRRALLIGIDKYVPGASVSSAGTAAGKTTPASRRADWTDLDGAVNDVDALQQILIARFGFKAEDIRILRNHEATRERILSETKKWLIDSAAPGDVSFFFYAGHGSQVKNSRSEEADQLDESIVPADANKGTPDIRDKELAILFGAAVERKLRLTIVFDSCHSGSIGRGAPKPIRFRFLQPDDRDVADPSRPAAPESRGALVLSAAQDYELAAETRDEEGRSHGLFSWAFLRTLRSMPVNQSADRLFLQVRALMQSGDMMQSPVLATTVERRRAPLFGTETQGSGAVAVAVQNVDPNSSVILQGGVAAGIRRNAELRQAGEVSNTPLRLRVVEELGISRSRAIAIGGASVKGLAPGTLFEIDRWTAAGGPALRVWVGSTTMPGSEVRQHAAAVTSLTSAPGITVISDPTAAEKGADVLQWVNSTWQVVSQGTNPASIGPRLSAASLASATTRGATASRPVAINLPLPSEAASMLGFGTHSKTGNDAIQMVTTPEQADYLLFGRARGDTIEYAWVRPLTTVDEARASALPAHTDWIPFSGDVGGLADKLREQAQRLGTIRSWLQLEPPADPGRFPYHLVLKNASTGELKTTGPTRDGERYDLILALDDAMGRDGYDRRFVYVFAVDSDGRSQLLYPSSSAGGVENRLPQRGLDELPKEIKLQSFTVTEPYGVDTFLMLTSATPLADPSVLEGEAVRGRAASRGLDDPLTRLLAQTGSGTRGTMTSTPTEWSFERLSVQSVAK
jgi:hypothetical protein